MVVGFRKKPFFKVLAAEHDGGDASFEELSSGVALSSICKIGFDKWLIKVERKIFGLCR
jgi:hypothetical protein